MVLVCAEHLERALDDFVDEKGAAPNLYNLEELLDIERELSKRCHYCEQSPVYGLEQVAEESEELEQ